MTHRIGVLAFCAGLVGCASVTRLTVRVPAEVGLPEQVRVLALMDRSGTPPPPPDRRLSEVAEGDPLDGEAADALVERLGEALEASGRVRVVRLPPRPAPLEGSFERPLAWSEARSLCEAYGAEALLVLEDVDAEAWDTSWVEQDEEQDRAGLGVLRTTIHARERTQVVAGWRLYWPGPQEVLDEVRDRAWNHQWSAADETGSEASARLPTPDEAAREVGALAGRAVAERFTPHGEEVERRWFPRGSPELVAAAHAARADDWQTARSLWTPVAEAGGWRAAFNLALADEREGALVSARTWAARAASGGAPSARRYQAFLEAREQP